MTKMINPAPNGWRGRGWIPGVHRGTDFGFYTADEEGSQRVVIAAAGEVISESVGGGYNDGWGNQYIVDHGYGIFTTYNHLRTGAMQLDVGQKVEAGTYVGQMGETGEADGVHLHFEVRINGSGAGNRVDPGPWLDGAQEIPGGSDPLAPTQRQVRSDDIVHRRIGAPNRNAPEGEPLQPNDRGNFKGWVTGEKVDGNDLWYVGISGDYFWSGGFTEISTHDLPDLNAPAPVGNKRTVGSDDAVRVRQGASTGYAEVSMLAAGSTVEVLAWTRGQVIDNNGVWYQSAEGWSWSGGFTSNDTSGIPETAAPDPKPTTRTVGADSSLNVRATPYTSDAIVAQLQPGAVVEVAGWTTGERVSNQGIWYKVAQGWAWSGGFTSQSTDGLESLPAPTPPSGGVIDPVYKTFKPDSALATWIGSPNYNYRTPRPAGAVPTHVTMHSMEGTLAGTDTQFQKYENVVDGRGDGSASNYGVGQNAVHQYVRERDYQQADGDTSSNRWGISIEHEGSVTSPATQAVMDLSARLLVEIAKRYGWTQYVAYTDDPKVFRELPDATQLSIITTFAAQNPTRRLVFPHDAWAATECPGVLPWQSIIAAANKELAGVTPDPDPSEIILSREFVEAQVAAAEAQAALWKGLLS